MPCVLKLANWEYIIYVRKKYNHARRALSRKRVFSEYIILVIYIVCDGLVPHPDYPTTSIPTSINADPKSKVVTQKLRAIVKNDLANEICISLDVSD